MKAKQGTATVTHKSAATGRLVASASRRGKGAAYERFKVVTKSFDGVMKRLASK